MGRRAAVWSGHGAMRVLTVYAHFNPASFCHAVLDEFTAGLREAGHEPDVLDLYAMRFDPVFGPKDMAAWIHPDMPPAVLAAMDPRRRVLEGAGGPVRRFLARRAMAGMDDREIARMIRRHRPKDAARHWRRVADADALAVIAPVYWLGLPAILKGWIERVFAYGDAFALDEEGWRGNVAGRIGLLRHERALLMLSTIFSEADYADLEPAMRRILCDWTLRYPGIERVDLVLFHGAAVADAPAIHGHLVRARGLGRDFALPAGGAAPAPAGRQEV